MKKKSMFSVFAIFGAILLFSFAGCASTDDFTQKEYSSEGNAIERIVIDVTDRELDIRASEDDRVHIYYYDSEKEFLDIDVSDNALTVKLTFDKEWTDFIGVKPSAEYRKIEISIPNGTVVDLSAKTTNEDIKVTSLSFSDSVSLDSNGGNIVCERINAGKSIALTAKNGNITGTVSGSIDDFSVSCKIKKGDCNLPELMEGGPKSFFADCNNGDIEIKFVD